MPQNTHAGQPGLSGVCTVQLRVRLIPLAAERNGVYQHLKGDGLAFNDGTTTTSPIHSSEGPKPLPHLAPTQDIRTGQILTPCPIGTSRQVPQTETLLWKWALTKQPAAPDGASWEKITLLHFRAWYTAWLCLQTSGMGHFNGALCMGL